MNEIKAKEPLAGSISAESALSGKLSCNGGLSGVLSSFGESTLYSGEYEIVPQAFHSQTLKTGHKLLTNDIVIAEVPYFETDNGSNGKTAYIAKET